MKLPELSIKNHQFTLVLFVLALIIGVNSFFTMPRTEDPAIVIPGSVIKVIYPGASPKDLEELVIKPIEEAINELDDIKKIKSTANNNFAIIDVEFFYGSADPNDLYDDVVQKVNEIKSSLPSSIKLIDVIKKVSSDVKILQIALVSENESLETLRFEAERLEEILEKNSGIKKADIHALPDRLIRVSLDMTNMKHMNITIDNVSDAIKSNNANIPGGSVDVGAKNFNIKTSGSYKTLDEIRNTVVGSNEGRLIYLRDIASVDFDYEENNYIARYNGERCIFISAEQKDAVNIIEVIEGTETELIKFKESLPKNIDLHYVINKADEVNVAINGFLSNLFYGILIVAAIVMMAIGFRLGLIVIIAIPSSILIGLAAIDLMGYDMQNISIAGLVISLGLLVDNSIVVTQNGLRYMQNGYNSREAAIKGTKQIGWPIVSSTVTTLLAFLPIIMMSDSAGEYTRSLPLIVIFVLLFSLIFALAISPIFIQYLFKNADRKTIKDQPIQKLLKKIIQGPYKRLLQYCLNNPLRILTYTLVLFIGTLVLGSLFIKTSYFGTAEKAQFLIRINAKDGTSLDETNKIAVYIEDILKTKSEVKHYATNVGYGNPKIHNNLVVEENSKKFAEIFVELNEFDKPEFDKFINNLRDEFSIYTRAEINIKELTLGVPADYPVEVVVIGDNSEKLIQISRDIEEIFSTQEGTINVKNEIDKIRTDLHVKINKEKAALLGVPTAEIDKTVRTAMNGDEIANFITDEGDDYTITLSLPKDGKRKFDDFKDIYIKSLIGKQIPLSQLTTIEFKSSAEKVTHYNTTRSATIGADVAHGYNTAEVTEEISNKVAQYPFPKGYSYVIAGESENQKSAFGSLGASAILAVIGIMLILIIQFKSFKQTLIVFSAIPLALIGSVIALIITGNTFSFTAFIGAISLIGIVINNSIILIDFTNELCKEGTSIRDALLEAGQVRFAPILITSLTTIAGLLPLTLQQSEMWTPLGWTIIGGLTLSTSLTLFVVPVLYLLFTKEKNMAAEVL